MRIQDIYIEPSTESVIAHLQDRLRDAWDHDRLEAYNLLDAISLCLKAEGYRELEWNKTAQAWTPITSV